MIRAILTDIEGTTSSIHFVHDVLFPYARKQMADFLRTHAAQPEVAAQLTAVRDEVGESLDLDAVIDRLVAWIDADRKITPLKALQGMIWESGFRNGDFTGHVYEDAVRNLQAWHRQGIRLYVFSSGSVQAQRLLFGHSDAGDLTPLFDGFYDTRVGAKRDPSAYTAIAGDIDLPPAEILFLSDTEAELDAARDAGMQTLWLVREAAPEATAGHRQVKDFDAIEPRA
ncbi:MAG: acireductone synthase [Gammaproteobacteria bacterium]|jgi:enolase-phosphatase E1